MEEEEIEILVQILQECSGTGLNMSNKISAGTKNVDYLSNQLLS